MNKKNNWKVLLIVFIVIGGGLTFMKLNGNDKNNAKTENPTNTDLLVGNVLEENVMHQLPVSVPNGQAWIIFGCLKCNIITYDSLKNVEQNLKERYDVIEKKVRRKLGLNDEVLLRDNAVDMIKKDPSYLKWKEESDKVKALFSLYEGFDSEGHMIESDSLKVDGVKQYVSLSANWGLGKNDPDGVIGLNIDELRKRNIPVLIGGQKIEASNDIKSISVVTFSTTEK